MRRSRCLGRRDAGLGGTARGRLLVTLVTVALGVAACSSAGSPQGSASSTTVSNGSASSATVGATTSPSALPSSSGADGPSAPQAAVRTIRITVRGKQVSPAPARVRLAHGETLRLVVTSDHADELHAHGFDIEKPLVAGQPLTVDLTGAAPGLYDVETHEPELRLLQVVVQ